MASRRRGRHVSLPLTDSAPSRGARFVFGAIAAALTVVFAVTIAMRDPGGVSDAGGWFVGEHAYAGVRADAPLQPGVRFTRTDRMRPLRLTYRTTVRDGKADSSQAAELTASREDLNGVPAWRITSHTGGTATLRDTLWVSAETFAPLRRVIVEEPYRRYDRIEVRERFDGLRVTGEMRAFRNGALAARRAVDRTLPAAFAPYVNDGFVPFFHAAVAMDRQWTGSVGLLGWAVRDDDVFASMAMRLDGQEMIHVPSGTFDCWRIAISFANGRREWYWVRKQDGLGIRVVDSTAAQERGIRETVLSAERAP